MEPIQYGIEKLGRLTSVMLHRPDRSLTRITEENRDFFLFDKVPDVDKFLDEHQQYRRLLESHGVKVYLLADHARRSRDLIDRLPNLAYLHDTAAVSSFGAIVSKMSSRGRCHEEIPVGEALRDLGIPILYEPPEGDAFEGCLLLGPKTVFVADTERHGVKSIVRFIKFILGRFEEVIYTRIPQERRFMHPDMVLGRITDNLMVYYPPALQTTYLITKDTKKQIDLKKFMTKRRVDLFPLSDSEQKQWGSSFVTLEPGVVINYDISLEASSVRLLEREGVRFIHFHPDALLAGGGSLRCLTMRLCRVSQRFTQMLYSPDQYILTACRRSDILNKIRKGRDRRISEWPNRSVLMINLFNRRELTITDSMERQGKIRELLAAQNIDYRIRVANRNRPGHSRGTLGLNMDFLYEYRIYVHKEDFKLAQAVIAGRAQ